MLETTSGKVNNSVFFFFLNFISELQFEAKRISKLICTKLNRLSTCLDLMSEAKLRQNSVDNQIQLKIRQGTSSVLVFERDFGTENQTCPN